MGLVVGDGTLRKPTHPGEEKLPASADQLRTARALEIQPFRRLSTGRTLYLADSMSHSVCSSFSFAGGCRARFFASVQSVLVSYNSQASSWSAGSLTAPVSQGMRCRVTDV